MLIFIEGLFPAVSIDQKSTSRNPRSTVESMTICASLFARGSPTVSSVELVLQAQTPQQIVDRPLVSLKEPASRSFRLLCDRKGEYQTFSRT